MGAAKDPAIELAEVARDLRRHVRWAQSIGEVEAPLSDGVAPSAPAGDGARHGERPPGQAEAKAAAIGGAERHRGRGRQPRPAAPADAWRMQADRAPAATVPTQALRAPAATGSTPSVRARAAADPTQALRAPARSGAAGLAAVRAELGDCRRCGLCTGRTNLVFGVGNPEAELVFVGEGPGADEDRAGEPFVGKAGQLLTRMIEAMGYRRDEVYICNVVKCRPPGNRNPTPEEIAACEPFLRGQIEAIRPRAIVALGKFAAQTLLRSDAPITRLRGNWQEYAGTPLMPTFHPAYLLRSPQEKAKAWSDLKQVLARLGRRPPAR